MQRRRAKQVPYESLPKRLYPELNIDKEELSRSMKYLRDETAVFWWSDGERGVALQGSRSGRREHSLDSSKFGTS
jgi:hypothetical protein